MAKDRIESVRWLRRLLVSAVLMALAIGAITTSTVLARSAPAAADNAYTIRLTSVQTHVRTFFTGPNGSPQPGDHFVFQQSIFYDSAQKMPAGSTDISCTFDWSARTVCSANADLTNRGQIVVEGISPNAPSFTIAILGGTGEFTGVGGTATITNGGQTVQTVTLHIQS